MMKPKKLSPDECSLLKMIVKDYSDSLFKGTPFSYSSTVGNENSSIDKYMDIMSRFSIESLFIQIELIGIEHPADYLDFAEWILVHDKSSDADKICKMICYREMKSLTRDDVRLFRKAKTSRFVKFLQKNLRS